MSTDFSPLADHRTADGNTWTWGFVDPLYCLGLTVRDIQPRIVRGIEHDLCALIEPVDLYLGNEGRHSLFGVVTPRWEFGLTCTGGTSRALELEICERLTRLDRLIDLESTAKLRPTIDYLP